ALDIPDFLLLGLCCQDIARNGWQMYAHQHGFASLDLAFYQSKMVLTIDVIAESDQFKYAVVCVDIAALYNLDGFFIEELVVNEFCDGAHLEMVFLCKFFQIRTTSHGAIFVHDFTDHTGFFASREASKITGSFGVASAGQHTTRLCHERKNMAGLHNIFCLCVFGGGYLDGAS